MANSYPQYAPRSQSPPPTPSARLHSAPSASPGTSPESARQHQPGHLNRSAHSSARIRLQTPPDLPSAPSAPVSEQAEVVHSANPEENSLPSAPAVAPKSADESMASVPC